MTAIRVLAIYLSLLAGLSAMAGELFRGTLTTKDNPDNAAIKVILILEQEGDFTRGWLAVGDTRQARVYGKSGAVLNLLWADGNRAFLRLEGKGKHLIGTWETGSELDLGQFDVRQKAGDPGEVLNSDEGRLLNELHFRRKLSSSTGIYYSKLALSEALDQAFPVDHILLRFAAADAMRLKEKETAATWFREAANQAYNRVAKKELAYYHDELTDLLNVYPEEAMKKYQSVATLPADKAVQVTAWQEKNDLIPPLYRAGSYSEALCLADESIDDAIKYFGQDHPFTLTAINNLGFLHELMGSYERALSLYKSTLALSERILGETHPNTLSSRSNLAVVYRVMSNYEQAFPLHKTILAQREHVLGETHPDTLASRQNLAGLYKSMGNYDEALPLHKTTLAQYEQVLGETHPDTLTSRLNLAGMYKSMGSYDQALSLYKTTLFQSEWVLGVTHPDNLVSQCSLAGLYQSMGRFDQVLSLYKTIRDQRERVLGDTVWLGIYQRALPLLKITQAQRKQLLGEAHHDTLNSRNFLVATRALTDYSQIRGAYLSLLFDHGGKKAGAEIMHLVLKRDGELRRIAIAANQQLRATDDPTLLTWVTEYRAKQVLLASLSHRVPKATQLTVYRKQMAHLMEELDLLKSKLSFFSSILLPEFPEPEPEILRQRLGPNKVLVSFLAFDKHEYKKSGIKNNGPYLIATIIKTDGETSFPVIQLGPLAPISENIETWRQAVIGHWSPDEIEAAGRAIYAQIWQPLASHLVGKDTIYVVADGPLHRLPIGALPGPKGQPLGGDRDLVFMDAVYDLLVPPVPVAVGTPLFCYAPNFGPGQTTVSTLQTGGLTRSGLNFTPLPGARAEGAQITALFEKEGYQPRHLTGEAATETALTDALVASTPTLLHIASHGFLLDHLPIPEQETKAVLKGELRTHGTVADLNPYTIQNLDPGDPLLRSGIAMAGANLNTESDSGDDGLLTALEAESLNLTGTRLVVLSACETGLGEQREGEGVYGLRRAFFLAGARALLTTLWPVDDIATLRFMERFYQLYLAGSSPRQALRQVQREFQASEHDSHPVFWAPFHLIEIPMKVEEERE